MPDQLLRRGRAHGITSSEAPAIVVAHPANRYGPIVKILSRHRTAIHESLTEGPIIIPSGPPYRFLVVDDNDDIRDLLVRMVERLGHSAEQASDGVEAVEALAGQRYDFMLLDLTMPRMSGEDVLAWLSDHPQHGDGLRVIVASAWAGLKPGGLKELGAYAVLSKPVRGSQLRDLIDAASFT